LGDKSQAAEHVFVDHEDFVLKSAIILEDIFEHATRRLLGNFVVWLPFEVQKQLVLDAGEPLAQARPLII